MVISFYYGGKLVGQTTTTCLEGCRLSLGQPGLPNTKLYRSEGLELVCFPSADSIPSERQRQVTRKLFGHLERGVLLHSSRQGVFVKRLCQGRVFCSGNAVVCKGRPNKLERDEVVQVFDTSQFFRGLCGFCWATLSPGMPTSGGGLGWSQGSPSHGAAWGSSLPSLPHISGRSFLVVVGRAEECLGCSSCLLPGLTRDSGRSSSEMWGVRPR